ncbi:MAG: MerR family transcriptional regulator [Eubacteriales bacterium]|nr:MerR family transcriptional regulator [Eubacteriales bacterium]
MKTVKAVSKIAGISVRTLQYYDHIGLLSPATRSEAGYRLYSDDDMRRLQRILLLRELDFPLKSIIEIMRDGYISIDEQIEILELKKARLENLISLAKKIKVSRGDYMDFNAFNDEKIEDYSKRAKELWGKTEAYKEFESKQKGRSQDDFKLVNQQLMMLFREFADIKQRGPESKEAQTLVKKLQDFITTNYYACTNEILAGLGKLYESNSEFSKNIDEFAGEGAAEFAGKAIARFCK